jgi:hypothetical protein
MNILGIHHGHDSCAALIRDGEIVADVAEERFTRIKHYCGMPWKSVAYCLEAGGIESGDLDVVAIATSYGRPDLNHFFGFPAGKEQRASMQRRALQAIRAMRGFSPPHPPIYMKPFALKASVEVINVDHHLAHAASAYFTSGSPGKQLVVTMDGSGDDVSTAVWRGENGRIELLEKWGFEGSLGAFYSLVTEGLGWWHGDGEGKTMGLAPYGDAAKAGGVLDSYVPRFDGGRLVRPVDFGSPQTWAESGAMHFHLRDASLVAAGKLHKLPSLSSRALLCAEWLFCLLGDETTHSFDDCQTRETEDAICRSCGQVPSLPGQPLRPCLPSPIGCG